MFKIEIQADAVQAALLKLSDRSRNLQPAMRAIAGLLEDRTAQNFADQAGPLGKWPALKRDPRNKKRSKPQILVDTARLKNSITSRSGPDFAQIGTNVIYANGSQRNQVNTTLTTAIQRKAVRTLKRQNARPITSVVRSTAAFGTENVSPGFVGLCHPFLIVF